MNHFGLLLGTEGSSARIEEGKDILCGRRLDLQSDWTWVNERVASEEA